MNKNVTLVCDLQFGSTGKGLISGYLAETEQPDVVVTAWSANAGHTYIDKNGRKFVHSMLANGIVSPKCRYVLMGPGSQINLDTFMAELKACEDIIFGRRIQILIHPHAAIIQQRHIDEEAGPMTKIGSTKKGCGAAMIDKIRRDPDAKVVAKDVLPAAGLGTFLTTVSQYNDIVDKADSILIEGAQGYSLGINSGFYPYCTSRECTPAQIAIDCAVPLNRIKRVVGTLRTFPIRVANRYDEAGNMIGFSGPCYPDQLEIQWDELGLPPEYTTVTKLKRRVFTFSWLQLTEALRACHLGLGCQFDLFLNFLNYLPSEVQDGFLKELADVASDYNARLRWVGTGPAYEDVKIWGQKG